MNLLQELGITKEELINRTIEKILEVPSGYTGDGDGFNEYVEVFLHDEVKKQVNNLIKNVMDKSKKIIDDIIQTTIKDNVNAVFKKPFQPIDHWGNVKGDPTTIQDLIANEATKYWTTVVNGQGNPTDGYGEKQTRAQFHAKNVMEEFYTRELREEARKMAKEIKDAIPETFISEISKSLKKYFK